MPPFSCERLQACMEVNGSGLSPWSLDRDPGPVLLSWSGKTGPQRIVGELNKESWRADGARVLGVQTPSNPEGRGEAEDCRPLKVVGKGVWCLYRRLVHSA